MLYLAVNYSAFGVMLEFSGGSDYCTENCDVSLFFCYTMCSFFSVYVILAYVFLNVRSFVNCPYQSYVHFFPEMLSVTCLW